ncbi:hypothetical protein FB451DRAFT_1515435 [Mycena latifolia]|nr:hypothetical protein FB451DRAFT_1515435 [Mycena latifolia]
MTTVPIFPAELQDLIVDHLHGHNLTLATCALVNKAWLRSSRYHLFGFVTLHKANWEGFLRILDSSSVSFVHSIRSLSIHDIRNLKFFSEMVQVMKLSIFPALRHLLLYYEYLTGVFAPDTTVDALGRVFANIRTLDIHLVAFDTLHRMVAFVSLFSQLEEISLCPTFLLRDIDSQPELHALEVPRKLRTVRFRVGDNLSALTSDFFAWLHAGEHPPTIRALELQMIATPSLPSALDLIRSLGAGLRDLDLKFAPQVAPGPYPPFRSPAAIPYAYGGHFEADMHNTTHIDLSRNTCLEHLTIHLYLSPLFSAPGAENAWALLSAVRAPLTTLTIDLELHSINMLDNLDWANLNLRLQTIPHLAALRRPHFLMHCNSDAMGAAEGEVRIRLSENVKRGNVDVSVLLLVPRLFTHTRLPRHEIDDV